MQNKRVLMCHIWISWSVTMTCSPPVVCRSFRQADQTCVLQELQQPTNGFLLMIVWCRATPLQRWIITYLCSHLHKVSPRCRDLEAWLPSANRLVHYRLQGQHPGSSAIYSASRNGVLPRQEPAVAGPTLGFLLSPVCSWRLGAARSTERWHFSAGRLHILPQVPKSLPRGPLLLNRWVWSPWYCVFKKIL